MFIYGPVVSSLIVPIPGIPETHQQAMIDDAGANLATTNTNSYYPHCWKILSSLMINGATAAAANVIG